MMAEGTTTFKGLPAKQVDGRPFRVAIVYARWNLVITSALVDGARCGRSGGNPRALRRSQGARVGGCGLTQRPPAQCAGHPQESAAGERRRGEQHSRLRGARLVRAAVRREPHRRRSAHRARPTLVLDAGLNGEAMPPRGRGTWGVVCATVVQPARWTRSSASGA